MTPDELKIELATILSEEENPDVDWANVQFLSERAYLRLAEHGTSQDFPHEEVIGYLAGFNRRRSDDQFGEHQRQWLRMFLRT
jgi:hypothetical protein